MKKTFSRILFLFIFSIFLSPKNLYPNSEIIKNAALGTTIGLSTYFLTQATRKTFQEWTATKTVLENCKTILNVKSIPLNPIDIAYACASGSYLTLLTKTKSISEAPTQNALRLWGLISLFKATKNIEKFEISSLIAILSNATSVSKIKSDSFSAAKASEENGEQNPYDASNTGDNQKPKKNNSQLKKAIKALPLQKYKKIYLTILFWSLWQRYKEGKISFSQKSFLELCDIYKYGILADLIADGSHKKTAFEFFITHFLSKLEINSYQLADFFKDFGIIEGLASTMQNFC